MAEQKEFTVVIGNLEHTVLGPSLEAVKEIYGNGKAKAAKAATPDNKAATPANK